MRWEVNEGDEEAKLMNEEKQTEVAPMALVRIGKSALQFTSGLLGKGDDVRQLSNTPSYVLFLEVMIYRAQ